MPAICLWKSSVFHSFWCIQLHFSPSSVPVSGDSFDEQQVEFVLLIWCKLCFALRTPLLTGRWMSRISQHVSCPKVWGNTWTPVTYCIADSRLTFTFWSVCWKLKSEVQINWTYRDWSVFSVVSEVQINWTYRDWSVFTVWDVGVVLSLCVFCLKDKKCVSGMLLCHVIIM